MLTQSWADGYTTDNQKNLLVRHTVTSRETCVLDAMYSRAFSEVKPHSVKVLKIH